MYAEWREMAVTFLSFYILTFIGTSAMWHALSLNSPIFDTITNMKITSNNQSLYVFDTLQPCE